MIGAGRPHRARIAGAQLLREAGVASPDWDSAALLACVLDTTPLALPLAGDLSPEQAASFAALIDRRAHREPLQHILGAAAFYGVDVAVGPGVFIPRVETESLVLLATEAVAMTPQPRILDLCSGSGAIAIALAVARPDADVTAIELDESALTWLHRNVEALAPEVRVLPGDAAYADQLVPAGLDLITCNPPYVPLGTLVPAEVAEFDPPVAVFAGHDGLDLIARLVPVFARHLRPGGTVVLEHDESHQSEVLGLFEDAHAFTDITAHHDLADRRRFVSARRSERDTRTAVTEVHAVDGIEQAAPVAAAQRTSRARP